MTIRFVSTVTMEFYRKVVFMFMCFCLFTLSATSVSSKLDSKTYFDVLRDFVNQNETDFLQNNRQNVKSSPVLKFLHNMENSFFETLLPAFNKNENPNTSTCTNDTGRLIIGLLNKDVWAVQFLDATGKPGPSLTQGRLNFVGNYDQCTSATAPSEGNVHGFHGGYFSVALKSPSIPILIQIGVCMPDTCSEEEIASLGREVTRAANVSVSVVSVQRLTNATEVTSATIVAIVVSCVIGLMMVLGTAYDFVFIQFPLWYRRSINKHSAAVQPQGQDLPASNGHYNNILDGDNPHISKETKKCDTHRPNSLISKILLAFSVYTNAKKILSVSRVPGSIESIHGIRFLSISWVVLGHTYFFSRSFGINIVEAFPTFLNRWTFDAIVNALVSVDTFFTLSGLLTSYLTIKQVLKKGLKLNWSLFYFHRFWRLTPPYMLSILLYLGFMQYFIKGPLRGYEQPMGKSSCEKNWWTNLLYINNLVNVDEMCFGHSWYLANDMQFFILSPLMMIPFYFHRIAGLCSCLVVLFASWITTGISSTLEEWPTTTLGLKSLADQAQGGMGNLDYFHHYYLPPWCRIGPFVVGILAGYVLAIHEGNPFYIRWWIVALGWITATGSALAVLYGLREDITGDNTSSVGVAALYNTISRSVWGACVSWVIIACTAGYGGPINVLLSWSPFVVLGRLSYMVYLLHIPVLLIFYQNLDQLFYMNDTTMVVIYLGLLVASNLVAFVFMLALESPMIGLEKAILKRGDK